MADFDPVSYMMGQKAAGGGGGGGGSSTLSGLTDVDISNPSDGQTLVYNATSGKWENGAGGGGSYTVFVGTHTENPVRITLDTTCADLYTACTNGPVGIRYTPEEGVTLTVSIAIYNFISDPDGGYVFVTADSYEARGAASDAPVFRMPH